MYTQENLREKAMEIYNLLSKGKTNAKSMSYIRSCTGYSKRTVSACIQRLRNDGYPVCSSNIKNPGYFIGNSDDILSFLKRLHDVRCGYDQTYDAMSKAFVTALQAENKGGFDNDYQY